MNELKSGWLAPDGEFFPVKFGAHYIVARDIVGERGYRATASKEVRNYPDNILLERGWVRISMSDFHFRSYANIEWTNFLTDYQKNFLRSYFEEPEIIMPDAMRLHWLSEE